MAIVVSDHAMKRIRKRIGISKKSAHSLAYRAFEKGIKRKDVKGSFKRYLDGIYFKYCSANNVGVYGNHVYLFGGTTLITVFTLPSKYKKYQKKGL